MALTALIVCLTVLVLWWRAEPMLAALVRVKEARSQVPVDPASIEVPKDLLSAAANYADDWAQADVLRVLREDYLRFGSWDLVRIKHGHAPKE